MKKSLIIVLVSFLISATIIAYTTDFHNPPIGLFLVFWAVISIVLAVIFHKEE